MKASGLNRRPSWACKVNTGRNDTVITNSVVSASYTPGAARLPFLPLTADLKSEIEGLLADIRN